LRVACALAVAAWSACAGIGGAQAGASSGQPVFFEPNGLLSEPGTRASTVAQLQHLGAHAIRVLLTWKNVAPRPNSPNAPRFNATNPASYEWGPLIPELEEAKRLHWSVLLTVTSPVPKWATSTRRDYLTRPNTREFAEFMTAAGREFRSEVTVWAIWNEPNQVGWLLPQFNANGTPASPAIYRGLFFAGYSGLKSAGIAQPKVLMGETAPFGNSLVNTRTEGFIHNTSPLAFLRGALCLDAQYRKAPACGQLPAYGFAHHAYTNSQGPSYIPPGPDEVTIGCLGRLTRALNLAAGAHAIKPNLPIYLTEFGINTSPNSLGVPPSTQAEQDAIAEHIAWENPRVAAFSQYALRDDPIPHHHPSGWIGFQTGLETASGSPKPLFYAWPLPLVVRREPHGKYYLWGLVRPASGITSVQVLIQSRRGQRYRQLARVQTGARGYWVLRSPVPGVYWKVRWVSPRHVVYEGPPMSAR
jgi:hypothetical protein